MLIDLTYKSHSRLIIKLLLDTLVFFTAFLLSYVLRFPANSVFQLIQSAAPLIFFFIVIQLICFAVFRLYSIMWRYSSLHTLKKILLAATFSTSVIIILSYFVTISGVSRSILIIDWLLVIFLSGAIRLIIREIYAFQGQSSKVKDSDQRVLIYGAGKAGELLLRGIQDERRVGIKVIGFIDDDPNKKSLFIHNTKILGNLSNIGELVRKYGINHIFISIPTLSGIEVRRILKTIREQVKEPLEIKTIPGLFELVRDKISINDLRKFEIRDLLRRKTVHLDSNPVKKMIAGCSVMVVGGGGSIGSELCRQIAAFNPARLIIIDNNEFNLYSISGYIEEHYPNLDFKNIVADACREQLMRKVFANYPPDLVFHSAAYKHVPLMELNPWAAVDNNITSTLTLVKLCHEFEVERFVYISTDKAVQPTSVMGASKRICEQIVLFNHLKETTKYLVVRFGNVLGSSGSVIPKFQSQIEAGGPVTVTHPQMTRYFMLVSEAVELVLQAGTIGEKGKIYVLDMGEPVNIAELARQLIELSGLTLDKDIKIIYTGLRPGEKLYERLYFEGEETATQIPNLLLLTPTTVNDNHYIDRVQKLLGEIYSLNSNELRGELKKLVPEYQFISNAPLF